mgnify:CR=1 FL=1
MTCTTSYFRFSPMSPSTCYRLVGRVSRATRVKYTHTIGTFQPISARILKFVWFFFLSPLALSARAVTLCQKAIQWIEQQGADMSSSERKNITQPRDWWEAFGAQATQDGLTLSEWLGECARANLRRADDGALSERAPAHRPAMAES